MKDIGEASVKADIKRMYLEKDVQKLCVDWARRRGYWARKFSSISQRSVPDYLFSRAARVDAMCKARIKFACEFKRPGHQIDKETGVMSTKAQVEEQEAMRLAGWFVFECDNFEVFKATVLAYEQECV